MKKEVKFYLGIDVSKWWFDLAVLPVIDHQKQPMVTARFDNTAEGMKAFSQWLKKQSVTFDQNSLLVIENTGVYHRRLWEYCSIHGLPIYIGNAAHIKWSFGVTRGKSDVIDSQRLCLYAFKHADEIAATAALDPAFIQLKDLMTARTRLLSQMGSIKVYLKELLLSSSKEVQKTMERSHKAALEGLTKSMGLIEQEINKILKENHAIKSTYELLISVPGIGHLTAVYLICCTNNFAVKRSGKQLACYAGVVPFESSSGTSIRGRNKVHQMANKDLKKMLHLCALAAINYYPEFKQYYERKKAEGKNGMSVINAVRNKIVLRAVAVVNKQQAYVDHYPKVA